MADANTENLLARLAGRGTSEGPDPWAAVAATRPEHDAPTAQQVGTAADKKLHDLLSRIQTLTGSEAEAAAAGGAPAEPAAADQFTPVEPRSFADAQLTGSDVEGLVLKLLLSKGDASGRDVSEHMKLPFILLDEFLRQMKQEQLIVHRGAAPMNDY